MSTKTYKSSMLQMDVESYTLMLSHIAVDSTVCQTAIDGLIKHQCLGPTAFPITFTFMNLSASSTRLLNTFDYQDTTELVESRE